MSEDEIVNESDKYEIQLRASQMPFPFSWAIHTFFVTTHNGKQSRFEVLGWTTVDARRRDVGFIYKDAFEPHTGLTWIPTPGKIFWIPRYRTKVVKKITGGTSTPAHQLYSLLHSRFSYPYAKTYDMWRGPNSNTFAQWVIDQIPGCGLTLPWNAWGKGYKK
jgi:hypothetical protein